MPGLKHGGGLLGGQQAKPLLQGDTLPREPEQGGLDDRTLASVPCTCWDPLLLVIRGESGRVCRGGGAAVRGILLWSSEQREGRRRSAATAYGTLQVKHCLHENESIQKLMKIYDFLLGGRPFLVEIRGNPSLLRGTFLVQICACLESINALSALVKVVHEVHGRWFVSKWQVKATGVAAVGAGVRSNSAIEI